MRPLTPIVEETSHGAIRWAGAALCLAALALYWHGLTAPLLFDDAGAVGHNASIRHWATALFPPADGSTTTGRPLLNLSFALNYALTGDSILGWHAGNLLIHGANVLLLFAFLRQLLRQPRLAGSSAAARADWTAFAAALLWSVHPLLTESVECVAQRSELLCAFFYLGTLLAFARAAGGPPGARWSWPAVSVAAAFAGMAAKEVMVTAPLLVLLLDRAFFAGSLAAAWRQRRAYYIGLFSSWLVLAFLLASGGGTRGSSAGLGLGVGVWPYLLKQTDALLLYLRLAIWPSPLVLDYGMAVVDHLGQVWWQSLVIVILLVLTAWQWWKNSVSGFVAAAFFVLLAPSSSVVPAVAQTMAEHRMYLPLAGLAAVLAAGILALKSPTGPILLAFLAVVYGALTAHRIGQYRSVLGLWQDNVASYPTSARAQLNLGVELLRSGEPAEARAHFARAAELSPGYALAHYDAGLAWQQDGHAPEALREYALAVRLAPDNPDMRVNLGNALVGADRAAEAVEHYEAALRLNPAADIHYDLARTWAALDRADEATAEFEAAVRLEPTNATWLRAAALWQARRGHWTEAAGHFQALIQLEPPNPDDHANYGNVLLFAGRTDRAIAEYRVALKLRPDDARTAENLRLALSQTGGPP